METKWEEWRDSFSHDDLRGKGVYFFASSLISHVIHTLATGSYLKSTEHLDPKGPTASCYGSSLT